MRRSPLSDAQRRDLGGTAGAQPRSGEHLRWGAPSNPALLLAFATLVDCSHVCTTKGGAVDITVKSSDGADVCDATVVVTSTGGYRQEIERVDYGSYDAAAGLGFCSYGTGEVRNPGSYTVTIDAPGFKESSTPMTLTGDDCGNVFGGQLTIPLESK